MNGDRGCANICAIAGVRCDSRIGGRLDRQFVYSARSRCRRLRWLAPYVACRCAACFADTTYPWPTDDNIATGPMTDFTIWAVVLVVSAGVLGLLHFLQNSPASHAAVRVWPRLCA